jgi:GH35 family endo-1,4-beta-xylanase
MMKNNLKMMCIMKRMNIKAIYAAAALLTAAASACDDEKMEWGKDPAYGAVTIAELPLPLQEAISRYEALNSYADFVLGVGIDLSLYMSDDVYRNVVNQNFDEITVGYNMKHGAMVDAQGEVSFTRVDALMEQLEAAGLSVYGHTLVWHQNQNAAYLNKLIAPEIIPGEPGENLLDIAGLQEGTFDGWNKANNADGITMVENAGLGSGDPAIRFEATASSSGEWATQLISPEIVTIEGHQYEFSFYVRTETGGEGRISFTGMSNGYPWVDGAKFFDSGSGAWTKVTYNSTTIGSEFTATGNAVTFAFDMGSTPSAVYYVDVNTIKVVDLDAEPTEINYVENGDFETGDFGSWSPQNQGDGMSVTEEAKYSGSYGAKIISSATSANAWDLQLKSPDVTLDAAKSYTFSFYVKSNVEGKGRISFPGGMNENEYPWLDWTGSGASEAFTTAAGEWTFISVDITNTTTINLSFDMGYLPDVTYYIDDVKIVEKEQPQASPALLRAAGPVTIEKSDEEKAQRIGNALESWITAMVTHYKETVHSWDVVNEPMDDGKPSALKTGAGKTPASDDFYWQDYLGKDYAVTAFKLARQHGNADDKLFINDYNLEQNLAKCDGLIEYVRYIEAQGATVDGVGTQMHISINTDKENIAQMFQKLAATGKLIKVSELDITVGTSSPTLEDYAQQAEMYRYVVEMYLQHIPENQRYGITVWGVSDNAKEHESWLPDDAPCLWDADYARKHAYKGFADGLAGKDVSADFSGELQY